MHRCLRRCASAAPVTRNLCTVANAAALRTLGLDRSTVTPETLKATFKEHAKKWHPDRHQGAAKVDAEAKFKEVQQAYQRLCAPGALRDAVRGSHPSAGGGGGDSSSSYYTGSSTYTHSGRRKGAAYQDGRYHDAQARENLWGDRFGPASRPGYNPHTSYMKSQMHYGDTAAAAAAEDRSRMHRMWLGFGLFLGGLGLVSYTSVRDRRAKERGELVDAWWNAQTRRWERPHAWMFKDPLVSSGIHLKPPSMVHAASPPRPAKSKPARTLDGSTARDAYRAREQGMR